jgi:hypothetical protein
MITQFMRYSAFGIFLFCFSLTSFSQSGSIRYTVDQRIEALVRLQGLSSGPNGLPQVAGYRVQLLFDAEKKVIDDARTLFINAFPKVDSYVLFNAPHFVLKVGDFRTSLDAERVRESLIKDFPASFIVKEMINLPRIDQE